MPVLMGKYPFQLLLAWHICYLKRQQLPPLHILRPAGKGNTDARTSTFEGDRTAEWKGPGRAQSVVDEQIYPAVQGGFTDANAYLRELTLKSMLVMAPKLSQRTLNQSLLKHLAKLQARPICLQVATRRLPFVLRWPVAPWAVDI